MRSVVSSPMMMPFSGVRRLAIVVCSMALVARAFVPQVLPVAGTRRAAMMPGASTESISEEEAKARTAWPHWKDETPKDDAKRSAWPPWEEAKDEPKDEKKGSDVDAVLDATLRCLETSVDAFDTALKGQSSVETDIVARVRSASKRITDIQRRLGG